MKQGIDWHNVDHINDDGNVDEFHRRWWEGNYITIHSFIHLFIYFFDDDERWWLYFCDDGGGGQMFLGGHLVVVVMADEWRERNILVLQLPGVSMRRKILYL